MTEVRINPETRIILLAEVDGWCMVRRPQSRPFVMLRKTFNKLSLELSADKADTTEGMDGA